MSPASAGSHALLTVEECGCPPKPWRRRTGASAGYAPHHRFHGLLPVGLHPKRSGLDSKAASASRNPQESPQARSLHSRNRCLLIPCPFSVSALSFCAERLRFVALAHCSPVNFVHHSQRVFLFMRFQSDLQRFSTGFIQSRPSDPSSAFREFRATQPGTPGTPAEIHGGAALGAGEMRREGRGFRWGNQAFFVEIQNAVALWVTNTTEK